MEDFSFFVGVIGNIISVLMFLSPVKTFWRIVKRRSTEDFDSLPYICTVLSTSLWTYYGITKPGEYLVATINGFGIVVETIYVALFLLYAPLKMRAKTAILVGILDVGFFVAAILVTQLALQGETRIDALGFLGAGLNIIMYVSPLAAIKTVVTTKSVEYMPFFLSFFFFLNGGIWTFYALLVRDYFLANVKSHDFDRTTLIGLISREVQLETTVIGPFGLVLVGSDGYRASYALRFKFQASNNEAEYEALIAGRSLARALNTDWFRAYSDSTRVVNQVIGAYKITVEKMVKYQKKVAELLQQFESHQILKIPRSENAEVDAPARLASGLDDENLIYVLIEYLAQSSID
ncbi:Bidirectional sugar transporter SWEET17 [Morus notabilis]|uniref:Bidirectional sugar transporter SWEET17 n=1 Tax=Morus notabilis TaxID=981085 RepID=W9RQV2_9ROSA|nr:Bidirectional sugar transporter SWEET17 [Morus notabilis]